MPFLDTQNILLSQFLHLQLDVQLFRGSLPSGGLCAALPSIIRRNSVAMMLLSIRMTALNKDVVITLIAHHGDHQVVHSMLQTCADLLWYVPYA